MPSNLVTNPEEYVETTPGAKPTAVPVGSRYTDETGALWITPDGSTWREMDAGDLRTNIAAILANMVWHPGSKVVTGQNFFAGYVTVLDMTMSAVAETWAEIGELHIDVSAFANTAVLTIQVTRPSGIMEEVSITKSATVTLFPVVDSPIPFRASDTFVLKLKSNNAGDTSRTVTTRWARKGTAPTVA